MEQVIKQYSHEEMQLFKSLLENADKKGKPKTYEILVDNLRAVEKTADVDEFDTFHDFIKENSRQVELRLYFSPNSPKFEKYILLISNQPIVPPTPTLSGIEIQQQIMHGIQAERERWEKDELKKELKEKDDEINDLEEYVAGLEKTIAEFKEGKNKLNGIHIGEIAGVAVEAMLRNNVHILEKYPMTKSLAGIILSDNKRLQQHSNNSQENGSAEFSETSMELSDEQKGFLGYMEQLKTDFNEAELQELNIIIDELRNHPEKLTTVKELIIQS